MKRGKRRGRRDEDLFESHDGHGDTPSRSASAGSRGPRRRKEDTKTEQLCRQVERRLSLALGELEDPVLGDVRIEAVEAGGGAELVVLVRVPAGQDAGDALRALGAAKGRLRREMAEAIHRKRTPQLSFSLAPPEEDEP